MALKSPPSILSLSWILPENIFFAFYLAFIAKSNMANDEPLTDDYVAGILARDAKESAIKYSALGLAAFSSQCVPSSIPAPP